MFLYLKKKTILVTHIPSKTKQKTDPKRETDKNEQKKRNFRFSKFSSISFHQQKLLATTVP